MNRRDFVQTALATIGLAPVAAPAVPVRPERVWSVARDACRDLWELSTEVEGGTLTIWVTSLFVMQLGKDWQEAVYAVLAHAERYVDVLGPRIYRAVLASDGVIDLEFVDLTRRIW